MKNILKTGAVYFGIALFSVIGFSVAHGYGGDPCKIGVTPPPGGFAITSLSGSTVTNKKIELRLSGGDAAYARVSNHSDFSLSIYFPSSTFNSVLWNLTSGYGKKTVYVKYLNKCQALPTSPVSVTVNYVADQCTIGVTPPSGGFSVKSNSGSTVRDPNIILGLAGGNAAYVEIANNVNFTGSTILQYAPTVKWILPGSYGYKTVYVRYLNSCQKKPSATVKVTINYVRS